MKSPFLYRPSVMRVGSSFMHNTQGNREHRIVVTFKVFLRRCLETFDVPFVDHYKCCHLIIETMLRVVNSQRKYHSAS